MLICRLFYYVRDNPYVEVFAQYGHETGVVLHCVVFHLSIISPTTSVLVFLLSSVQLRGFS